MSNNPTQATTPRRIVRSLELRLSNVYFKNENGKGYKDYSFKEFVKPHESDKFRAMVYAFILKLFTSKHYKETAAETNIIMDIARIANQNIDLAEFVFFFLKEKGIVTDEIVKLQIERDIEMEKQLQEKSLMTKSLIKLKNKGWGVQM